MSDAYDPNAPEGSTPQGNAYLSKRDLRVLLAVVIVLAVLLTPIYKMMERNAEKARCVQNIKAIGTAMGLYAENNDDRLPPLVEHVGEAVVVQDGAPVTWATVISPYMSNRASFECPTASEQESSTTWLRVKRKEARDGENEETVKGALSYGLYAPYSGFLKNIVADPSRTILVAETSNRGARDTFDPLPFQGLDGQPVANDAFAIGFNDANFAPTPESTSVTRLAIYNVKNGNFQDGVPRHDKVLHALSADGSLQWVDANVANLRRSVGQITGAWQTPATRSR